MGTKNRLSLHEAAESDDPQGGDVAASFVADQVKGGTDGAGEMERKTCQVRRCLAHRRRIGQQNGAFLFAYTWTENGIIIELPCRECNTNHHIELTRPG